MEYIPASVSTFEAPNVIVMLDSVISAGLGPLFTVILYLAAYGSIPKFVL